MEGSHMFYIIALVMCFVCVSAQTKALGEPCDSDIECSIPNDPYRNRVWCYNKLCSCKRGYARQDINKCVIGGDCVIDSDCADLNNSYCNTLMRDRAKCACKVSFTSAENNTKCLGQVGSTCRNAADCAGGNNVVCTDGICTCSTTAVPTEDGKTCIPTAGDGEICLLNKQCSYSDQAECVRGRCQCVNGLQYNGTTCKGNITLGDKCVKDTECTVPHDPNQKTVWCYNGQCACKSGYLRQDDKCVVGGDCLTDTDCQYLENSFCNTHMRDRAKCACNATFVAAVNSTKCLRAATKVGDGCWDSLQCTANLGKAECTANQRCACENGVRATNDNTRCGAPVSTVVSISCLALIILVKLL